MLSRLDGTLFFKTPMVEPLKFIIKNTVLMTSSAKVCGDRYEPRSSTFIFDPQVYDSRVFSISISLNHLYQFEFTHMDNSYLLVRGQGLHTSVLRENTICESFP